jgi:hypothetical protein
LPGSQDLVYFAKDIVLLAAYVGFWNSRAQLRFRLTPLPGLAVALGLAAFFGALQVFNPRLPSLALGVLGFRSYFLYAPLAFVLPAAFDDDAALGRFLKWYLLIPIPVGLLAGLQFFAPGGSALNVYARGGADTVSTFGSSTYVRVTGTFSYISGYGGYLLASAILLLIVFATVRWRLRGHLRLYAALTMTILGMLMTGSRGAVPGLLGTRRGARGRRSRDRGAATGRRHPARTAGRQRGAGGAWGVPRPGGERLRLHR